jgi:hypothetical protein
LAHTNCTPQNLASCDFILFLKLKLALKGRRFNDISTIQEQTYATPAEFSTAGVKLYIYTSIRLHNMHRDTFNFTRTPKLLQKITYFFQQEYVVLLKHIFLLWIQDYSCWWGTC